MKCVKCQINDVPLEAFGFACESCSKNYSAEIKASGFIHTCFQCGQKYIVSEAIWQAYGWAVTYGVPGTTYHCKKHYPAFKPKINVDNHDLKQAYYVKECPIKDDNKILFYSNCGA